MVGWDMLPTAYRLFQQFVLDPQMSEFTAQVPSVDMDTVSQEMSGAVSDEDTHCQDISKAPSAEASEVEVPMSSADKTITLETTTSTSTL